MADISEIEVRLESIRDVYDDICAQADEDGFRDDVELAMIARVDAKIKTLEAELRVAKAKQKKEHDPKAAWDEIASLYKDLLRLQADLAQDEMEEADDLEVYLKAISSHLATEDWESAVNELFLAGAWVKKNDLWSKTADGDEDTEEEDTQREEDEDSGKTVWEKSGGDVLLEDARAIHRELVEEGSRHAGPVGKFCDAIQDALNDEAWKTAVTQVALLDIYLRDHDLIEDDEEEDEQDEGWLSRASDLAELTALVKRLLTSGINGTLDVAATLGQITAAAASRNYEEAERLLDDALVRARELAESLEQDDEYESASNPEKAWKRAAPTYRKLLKIHAELSKEGAEEATDLNVYLEAVAAALATQDWPTAINEVVLADSFAEENGLWESYADETESSEDDASGKTVWDALDGDTRLEDLHGLFDRLDAQGNEHAARMKELLRSIDTAISEENWKSATSAMIILEGFVRDNDLETVADENSFSSRAMSELSGLVDDLMGAGVEAASEIASTMQQITAEAAAGNFETAQELLEDALEAAREAAEEIEEATRIDPSSASISASVGRDGKNKEEDVVTVQRLLNRSGAGLDTDGDCGSKTIRAIENFQQSRLGWKDGRVDPGGKTFAALTGAAVVEDVKDAVTDAVEDAAEAVVDTAGSVVETVTDMIEDAGDFFEDFLGGDDDEDEDVRSG